MVAAFSLREVASTNLEVYADQGALAYLYPISSHISSHSYEDMIDLYISVNYFETNIIGIRLE